MGLHNQHAELRDAYFADEATLVRQLIKRADLDSAARKSIAAEAAALVSAVRDGSDPSMMESFLAEYGLSTDEGVALMCLAEALLRVPDSETVDDLIRDKITPHDWGAHVGDSGSIMVNASTWALMLTGKVLDDEQPGVVGALRNTVRRLGEPVVRVAVKRAMQEMGDQFVLGETIKRATKRGNAMVDRGYTYSYDMLGEAARTHADAERYFQAYVEAIAGLAERAHSEDIRENPGISVKLSALHPRYEYAQSETANPALIDKLTRLAHLAANARIGLNIDAEEANRLEPSLDIVEALMADPALQNWAGLGVVVQAYGRRCPLVIDALYEMAQNADRQIMVRLVKGAYWDTEIKNAQVLGVEDYPVFTRKVNTDVSYIACAKQLFTMRDRIYPQFATHNAHSCAAIVALANGKTDDFEFQRLHGMGEALHEIVRTRYSTRCRIYAPVGAHEDLLAYLVRRLLENGANSSFVNQIVDESIPAETIAADPFAAVESLTSISNNQLDAPDTIFAPRQNSRGYDVTIAAHVEQLQEKRQAFMAPYQWQFGSVGHRVVVQNPATLDDTVGHYAQTDTTTVDEMLARGRAAQADWSSTSDDSRATVLEKIAERLEAETGELVALLTREAGKSLADAVAEIREAVDFCRYYALQCKRGLPGEARGVVVCISPWNFPLAIFAGQVVAALAAGNAVIAKPAEQTTLIGARTIDLMHDAGIPADVLQLACGDGRVGAALTQASGIDGVCFTGSTEVARLIERALAKHDRAETMLIAETGGLNAMLVDSTALNEQAVRDIVASAFQSAGQRCSALRILYVQKDRAQALLEMLFGAMDALQVGDPQYISTDVGPLIDREAQNDIRQYVAAAKQDGRVVYELAAPPTGHFLAPVVIQVAGIQDMQREVFGPVLHVATFDADDVDEIIEAINERGYGLTLGLHTRIDARAQRVIDLAEVGNVYVNRNQIGAIVGSQPFGGEGLSGTGPKAGGPLYLERFRQLPSAPAVAMADGADADNVQWPTLAADAWARRDDRVTRLLAIAQTRDQAVLAACASVLELAGELPGPTGESNRYQPVPLGRVLCLHDDGPTLRRQVLQALAAGNSVLAAGPRAARELADLIKPDVPLATLSFPVAIDALVQLDANGYAVSGELALRLRRALAQQSGPIRRVITEALAPGRYCAERAVCIDTTAAGGNAQLLAANS